jgi:acyl-CoA thioester hydrolase
MGEPLVHTLRVRYAECDVQGVVFNAHYLAYADVSLTELMRSAFGGYGELLEHGLDLVVAEARLRFRGSARFDDVLELSVAITRLGTTSIDNRHEIARGGEQLVAVEMRHVLVDRTALRKTPIPDWVRDGLAPWIVDAT